MGISVFLPPRQADFCRHTGLYVQKQMLRQLSGLTLWGCPHSRPRAGAERAPGCRPQVSGSLHCQTHILLPAARAGGGASVHPLPLGKEAPLQTLALRREPGSSPDARGPVRPPSLVGTRVLACPAALRSRRPPATSAFVHDGKFLLLSYRRITFVEEMHDFNLKR